MSASLRISTAVSLLAFMLLAFVASGPGILPGDKQVADWLFVSPNSSADSIARGIAWTMRSSPVAAIALASAVLAALRSKWRAAGFLIAVIPLMHLSFPLKELIASPRPNEIDGDWGFPAGRAGNSVFVAGALAYVATRPGPRWRWAIAGCWFIAVGWSRIATGDQWPSDVVGAWLWSAPTLVFLATVFQVSQRNECGSRH